MPWYPWAVSYTHLDVYKRQAEVYALIVPIHYRLTREQVRQMAEAADENDLLAVVKNTKYGKYLDGEEQLNLERCMEKMQEAVHSVLLMSLIHI